MKNEILYFNYKKKEGDLLHTCMGTADELIPEYKKAVKEDYYYLSSIKNARSNEQHERSIND